ncbi:MAG: TraR/DksA family transcriptional regulator [Saprospiraceae bacterium]
MATPPQLNRAELRTQIKTAIAAAKSQITDYEADAEPISPDNSIGRISRLDAINNKSVVEAALRQTRRKLAQLKFALAHVDDERFGLCQRCAQPIPVQRILLMPQSGYCIRCAR